MNYQRIHDAIIERAMYRLNEGYIERHHIMPKCLGGSNEEYNIVELTAREHFIVHLLLTKMYPNDIAILRAFWMMANRHHKQNSKSYEQAKIAVGKHTIESRNKMSIAVKNSYTPELIEGRRLWALARWDDPNEIAKQSQRLLGKNKGKNTGPRPECGRPGIPKPTGFGAHQSNILKERWAKAKQEGRNYL